MLFLTYTFINSTINTSESIYTDTNIDEWIIKKPTTRGGSIVSNKIIKNPINDKDLLISRQNANFEISKFKLDRELEKFKIERNVAKLIR